MKTAVLSFFAALWLLAGPAWAAGDVYRVSGVPVDATADNASAAKNAALEAGQKAAFERLLKRLAPRGEWQRLPSAEETGAQSYVRSFQVENERTSSTRYLANLTVTFNQESVRRLLSQRGIAFSDTQARPAVLLTLWQAEGSGSDLWGASPWRKAWNEMDLANRLTPVTLPLGDLEDLAGVTADQALSGNEAALGAFAERYGTDRVIVARAKPAGENGLEANVTLYQTGSVMPPHSWQRRVSGEGGYVALGKQAASAILDEMAEEWKAQSTVERGVAAALSASVRFSSLGEWANIRRQLERLTMVQRVNVVGLSKDGALVEIDYMGDPGKLSAALAQQNLSLLEMDDYWVLAARQQQQLQPPQ